MEEGLDHLINLIEKSLNLDSQEKIKKIEEEIQVAFQKFKEELSGQTKESLNIDKDKVDRLSLLLKELIKLNLQFCTEQHKLMINTYRWERN